MDLYSIDDLIIQMKECRYKQSVWFTIPFTWHSKKAKVIDGDRRWNSGYSWVEGRDTREFSAVVGIILYLDLGSVYTHTHTHFKTKVNITLYTFINEETRT